MSRRECALRRNNHLHSGVSRRSMLGWREIEETSLCLARTPHYASGAALSKLNMVPPPDAFIDASTSMIRRLAQFCSTGAANSSRARLYAGARDAASSSSCPTGQAA